MAETRTCVICGEHRAVQKAHINPRRHGGKITMSLCATHHWNYDHKLLTGPEMATLAQYLKRRDVLQEIEGQWCIVEDRRVWPGLNGEFPR